MTAREWLRHTHGADVALSALLLVQCVNLFVAVPLAATHPASRFLLDAGHLTFAAVSVGVLTKRRASRALLLVIVAVLAGGPFLIHNFAQSAGFSATAADEMIGSTAFLFNGLVTALVARHVFGGGRVTAHRVQGAVLIYLNVAALFSIAFNALEMFAPGAFVPSAGGLLSAAPGARIATLNYFSLSTITTTGYGDLIPVHALARSLANLEAVFGQLFPATLLARLVALHLAHRRDPG